MCKLATIDQCSIGIKCLSKAQRLRFIKLGTSPTVDFAFVKTFARPENNAALIRLLDAILTLDERQVITESLQDQFLKRRA